MIIFINISMNMVILLKDICENAMILSNNIYVNSKCIYSYGINAPVINPDDGRTNKYLSYGLFVKSNVIIMISSNVAEAIYNDAFTSSEFSYNNINIISNGSSYGIALAKIDSKLSNINITGNEIIIHSPNMSYLIELYMVDNSTIINNTLYSDCNGSFGIGVYMSNNLSIEKNNISLFGGKLVDNPSLDVLGLGNSAIALIRNAYNVSIMGNLIYTNVTSPIGIYKIINLNNVTISDNSYVIDDDNIDVFFNDNNTLKSEIIGSYNLLLFNNITNGQILKINLPLNISSYNNIPISVNLILNENASYSRIFDINFINSTILLDNASNIIVKDSIFNSSNSNILQIKNGFNNTFINNILNITSNGYVLRLINSCSSNILNNNFTIDGINVTIIENNKSNYTLIEGNRMDAMADDNLVFIYSHDCKFDNVIYNNLNGNANSIFGYFASNVNCSLIGFNNIVIKGLDNITNQSGVYYQKSSSNNNVTGNDIFSFSVNADDYAVIVMSDRNSFNSIVKNYLISSNGTKKANFAVYSPFDVVDRNTPMNIYVAINGSDVYGDGTMNNPYSSISYAVKNALNHTIIYVGDGIYFESGIIVDKDLEIVATSSNVGIDAKHNQLFNITEFGFLSISSINIQNAYDEMGGSVFINGGSLSIINSTISNSSSFHDNSHPVFDRDVVYDKNGDLESGHTQNYVDTGKGGAILNYGKLYIESSIFYDNFGHWGGVISDYGKTSINSSLFFNNRGVHGGVIYTNSKSMLEIVNSVFKNNTAITCLDYCSIRIVTDSWSIDTGNHYTYYSDCGIPIGRGGVIYTHNTPLSIVNSNLTYNSARSGGVIATQIDSFTSESLFESNVDLLVENCTLMNNNAKDTRYSTGSVDLDYFGYKTALNGGAIYGTFNKCYISGCEFYHNIATGDGGAIYAKADDGKILDSKFIFNIAGISGGALELSKNFVIMRTIISNNTASYGGAINYDSYSYYGHIQNNFNIYNSTISHNRALTSGGAFDISYGNISIHDSNIVDNLAPAYDTIHTSGGSYAIDMRYNYWGINDGFDGPDNSVWKVNINLFKPWYKEWIHWEPKIVESDSNDSPIVIGIDDPNKGQSHKFWNFKCKSWFY